MIDDGEGKRKSTAQRVFYGGWNQITKQKGPPKIALKIFRSHRET